MRDILLPLGAGALLAVTLTQTPAGPFLEGYAGFLAGTLAETPAWYWAVLAAVPALAIVGTLALVWAVNRRSGARGGHR